MATLYHMPYSPWSERARWALNHHRFEHARKTFTPMISEPGLRLKLKRPTRRFTLPILIDGNAIIEDSYDIARHADTHGTGVPLFPDGAQADIAEWNRRAERALEAGRSIHLRKTAADPEAKRANLPPKLPAFALPMVDLGLAYFTRKYDLAGRDDDTDRAIIRETLLHIRDALGGRDTLLDAFSYADIVAASPLSFVVPVAEEYWRVHPVIRASRSDAALADEFADLVTWRDNLYARYRRS